MRLCRITDCPEDYLNNNKPENDKEITFKPEDIEYLYDKHATYLWKHKFLALTLKDFAYFINELAFLFYYKKEALQSRTLGIVTKIHFF